MSKALTNSELNVALDELKVAVRKIKSDISSIEKVLVKLSDTHIDISYQSYLDYKTKFKSVMECYLYPVELLPMDGIEVVGILTTNDRLGFIKTNDSISDVVCRVISNLIDEGDYIKDCESNSGTYVVTIDNKTNIKKKIEVNRTLDYSLNGGNNKVRVGRLVFENNLIPKITLTTAGSARGDVSVDAMTTYIDKEINLGNLDPTKVKTVLGIYTDKLK